MNKTKVERLLKNINEVINEDIPTNAEYIVSLANMLRVFDYIDMNDPIKCRSCVYQRRCSLKDMFPIITV